MSCCWERYATPISPPHHRLSPPGSTPWPARPSLTCSRAPTIQPCWTRRRRLSTPSSRACSLGWSAETARSTTPSNSPDCWRRSPPRCPGKLSELKRHGENACVVAWLHLTLLPTLRLQGLDGHEAICRRWCAGFRGVDDDRGGRQQRRYDPDRRQLPDSPGLPG